MANFSAADLQKAGKTAIDFYLKNKPIDQVAVERPLLRKLMAGKKSFPGGKQYIVEQLRYQYDSNFQWFHGDSQVTYNKKDTIQQAEYEWYSCHDGFTLNEDELFQNGITIVDGPPRVNSRAQALQLTNLFEEHVESLRLGFEEKLSFYLHHDYSATDAEALEGLDTLVAETPTNTVGNISGSTYSWWQNYSQTGLSVSNIVAEMELGWRSCVKNGGRPDCILMGSNFLDTFREATKNEITRYTVLNSGGQQAGMDPSIGPQDGMNTGLHFQNVPIYWMAEDSDIDANFSLGDTFVDRCYMLNCKHLRLRPAAGHDMVSRTPPRVYDRYAYYWGLTWKGALTTGRRNAHAVFRVS